MSQRLPTHEFSWTQEPVDFLNTPDDSDEGYILEVDLEYPPELHHQHNCYPWPRKKLLNKEKYVIHYRNLNCYVKLGLKVTKVHRILKFQQSEWLKNYINFNTEQRQKATTNFEKDLFKLLNNAVFGKTIENLRNRVNIDLVTKGKLDKKLVASPTFESFQIITEDLVSIQRQKTSLFLNRPIFVGFSILDISKILMNDFHFNFIKKTYDNGAKLLFTDTDSLYYHIPTEDVYKDISEHAELFDTAG
ncbi:hypothetical protein AVEN_265114-1 [Araneus ventricosus]|uniref:DNA-directed DNA polymerase n=1 Tax=Araneus ventricosus TaxID=182803 RepID=A0A4Y2NIV6_ARAVE|nr:hypothetical protein AVEN_265114-1 [Araneus ventricosus]